MKILILGGNGMLGHQLFLHFNKKHQVKVTLRSNKNTYEKFKIFNNENAFYNVDISNLKSVENLILDFKPEVVINGIGITHKGRETDVIGSIEVNALLPHHVAQACKKVNAKFFQISTDCVFLGTVGNYTETDVPDAQNLYGRTKLLGEVEYDNCLTLRTSIIGLEIDHKHSLVEWFLSQKTEIKGFDLAIFSGVTTLELSRVIERLLDKKYCEMKGIWHVSSQAISKFQLLSNIKESLGLPVKIYRDEIFQINRSLDGKRFTNSTGIKISCWPKMIEELVVQIKQRNLTH